MLIIIRGFCRFLIYLQRIAWPHARARSSAIHRVPTMGLLCTSMYEYGVSSGVYRIPRRVGLEFLPSREPVLFVASRRRPYARCQGIISWDKKASPQRRHIFENIDLLVRDSSLVRAHALVASGAFKTEMQMTNARDKRKKHWRRTKSGENADSCMGVRSAGCASRS